MINLSPEQLAAVLAVVTNPRYLVKIDLDEERYFSTRDQVAVDDEVYVPGYLQLRSISDQTAEFSLYNENYIHTQNAINGVYMGNRVQIWWAYSAAQVALYVERGYWEEGYTDEYGAEPERFKLFDGIIDSFPVIDDWLSVSCTRVAPRRYPFAKIRPPIANHAPVAGYSIFFDGALLKISGSK